MIKTKKETTEEETKMTGKIQKHTEIQANDSKFISLRQNIPSN